MSRAERDKVASGVVRRAVGASVLVALLLVGSTSVSGGAGGKARTPGEPPEAAAPESVPVSTIRAPATSVPASTTSTLTEQAAIEALAALFVPTTTLRPAPRSSPLSESSTTTSATSTTTGADVAGMEREFVARVNNLRASEGAERLATDGALASVARRWSQTMASSGSLGHNPNLSAQVPPGWSALAENVLYGTSDVSGAFQALNASSGHRSNMVDPSFTRIGVGVAIDSDGAIWVTQIFTEVS